jgi:transcriptional regulator with XRE-family HTH domain
MPDIEKLVQMKQQCGLTTQQIADKSGVPASSITRMLKGQTEEPSFSSVAKTVKAMGGSLDELVGIEPKTVTITNKEIVHEDERLISLYERAIASKNRWIRWLFIILLILIVFVIGLLIFDILDHENGWYRQTALEVSSGSYKQHLALAKMWMGL